VALWEFGQQAHVRQTKGSPALAGVHRRHLATGNINGVDWWDINVPSSSNVALVKKQNEIKW